MASGGLLTTFKIQDRIYASRKAVAEVLLECQKYDYRIEEHKDLKTEEKAFIQFSRSIGAIQGQQMLQEVELWNPKKEEEKEERLKSPAPQGEEEDQILEDKASDKKWIKVLNKQKNRPLMSNEHLVNAMCKFALHKERLMRFTLFSTTSDPTEEGSHEPGRLHYHMLPVGLTMCCQP